MIIAIILGGLAAYQLYAVTQTQNLLIQSQKNMSSIAMWKTMLISKAKAVGYDNEIVLPYGDNATNYQTPPKWVYFNTKNPWGKDIIYCPISKHNSGSMNKTVAIAGGTYGVETKSNFATIFNNVPREYVISSNQSFSVNTTDVLAFLISPTPSTTNQVPSCNSITFDSSDNIYKVENGLVDIITKGDVETFANLSMLAGQKDGTSSSSSAYLTTIEGDSSVTGNTFNANMNYIISSDINYAHIKLPSGTHSLESINIGDFSSNYNAVKKTLIIEGDEDGSTVITSPTTSTLDVNNYNIVLVNVTMYQNVLIRLNNSLLKTTKSTIGNITLKLSDWFVIDDTSVISSNLTGESISLKGSRLIIINDKKLTVTEKSGNALTINVVTSELLLDENSTLSILKSQNLNTISLTDSKLTADRAFININSSGIYNSDFLVDDSSNFNLYNTTVRASGKSENSLSLGGQAVLTGSSIIPQSAGNIGISIFNGGRLTMKGVDNVTASIGSATNRYIIPVHDVGGSYAGGLPAYVDGPVILYAGGNGSTCAGGNLFGYSKSTRETGQTTENDYALIGDDTLSAIISKLNASNWLCNKI